MIQRKYRITGQLPSSQEIPMITTGCVPIPDVMASQDAESNSPVVLMTVTNQTDPTDTLAATVSL